MLVQQNMMILKSKIYSVILCVCFLSQAFAQKPIVSPRDSVKINFNGKLIAIHYGKPSMLGRKIFGGFVPYYKVWRTGAGAATLLTTEADLEVDGAVVPRGTYSIYTLPAEERWKLIINKQTGQWGTTYLPQLDLARIDLTVKKLKTPVEVCTFKLEKNGAGSGTLRIEWEKTSLSVPFHISKDSLVPSPLDSTVLSFHDKRISIVYSRPSMRGRKIMGGVVPYNVVWRTGANAATSFNTQADIILSGVKLPHGSYTLYTLPSPTQWKLIISRQTEQWGTVYNQKFDLARIPMNKKTLKQPVEKFTMTLEKTSDTSGIMKLAWEKTQLSIPFQFKEEKHHGS
jgi:hypothetical protein